MKGNTDAAHQGPIDDTERCCFPRLEEMQKPDSDSVAVSCMNAKIATIIVSSVRNA